MPRKHSGPKNAESASTAGTASSDDDDGQAYKPVPYVEEVLVGIFLFEVVFIAYLFCWDTPVDWDILGKLTDGQLDEFVAAASNEVRMNMTGGSVRLRGFGVTFPLLVFSMIGVMGLFVELSKWCMSTFGLQFSRLTTAIGMANKDVASFGSPLDNPVTMKKFREQGWQLAVHVLMSVIEFRLVATENPAGHLMGPDSGRMAWDATHAEMGGVIYQPSPWIVLLYASQLAVWIYTAFVCWAVDERKKDFLVMMSHHVVTIALITGSAYHNHLRVGLMVLWVHDVSDIFVDSLKMLNFLALDNLSGLFMVELSYFACLAAWFYWRLVVFPFVVIQAAMLGSGPWVVSEQKALAHGFAHGSNVPPITDLESLLVRARQGNTLVGSWLLLNGLLVALQLMHVWWFLLLLRLGFRMVADGNRKASEQSYEGSTDRILAQAAARKDKNA